MRQKAQIREKLGTILLLTFDLTDLQSSFYDKVFRHFRFTKKCEQKLVSTKTSHSTFEQKGAVILSDKR